MNKLPVSKADAVSNPVPSGGGADRNVEAAGLAPVVVAVIWVGTVAVGVGGLWLRYPWPKPFTKSLPPPAIQLLDVQVTKEQYMSPETGQSSDLPMAADERPAAAPAFKPPAVPPLPAVAAPGGAVAFALPVEGPARIAPSLQPTPVRARPDALQSRSSEMAATAPARAGPVAQQLTYGEGEGRQPAPEYPREAALAGQQGTVVVRFTVGEDGGVRDAEASVPASSALLNQAAVRAVRETWRFHRGPVRTYEVSIEFDLKQK